MTIIVPRNPIFITWVCETSDNALHQAGTFIHPGLPAGAWVFSCKRGVAPESSKGTPLEPTGRWQVLLEQRKGGLQKTESAGFISNYCDWCFGVFDG